MNNSTIKIKNLETLTLQTVDYVIFGCMLLLSIVIGVYFGIYKKQNTRLDYLLGGKNMGIIPIAISLSASYTSGVTVLGMPAELYTYGFQYVMTCVGAFLTTFIIGTLFLPVFYELQVTSSFEYLALRFDEKIRCMASFLSLFGYIMFIPIVMYVPALALNLVTGMSIKYITLIMCIICIFYTTIGGFKAVVWADTIQWVTMIGSICVIVIFGIPNEGGLKHIWNVGIEGDRVEFFDLDVSFYKRMTFWGIMFGSSVTWICALGVNQVCVQRFMSLRTMSQGKIVLYLYSTLVLIFKALCLFVGLIIYARYSGCDPLTAGKITKSDQILPYYVLDVTRNIPGMPGMFIAGVFSASLSTMSTVLNSSCGIVYNDFLLKFLPENTSEERASTIMKILVVVIGSVGLLLAMWVDKLGGVIELTVSFDGITSGALLGIFSVGMLYPRANAKGTIIGAITSLTLMVWTVYNSKKAAIDGFIKYPTKPFSLDQCDSSLNLTMNEIPIKEDLSPEDVFFLYRLSFMWYSLMGFLTVHLVAVPISYMTEPPTAEQVKPEYFSPIIRKYVLKKSVERNVNIEMCDYEKVKIDNLNK